MARRRHTKRLVFGLAWVAIVSGAVGLSLRTREEYPLFAILSVVMAVLMGAIFLVKFVLQAEGKLATRIGQAAGLGLIVGALAVLTLPQFLGDLGLLHRGVLLFFTVIFVKILLDYVHHIRTTPAKKPSKAAKADDVAG